jgi:hypothetical protein
MKPAVFLRIASVLTLLHGVLHTIGGVFGKAPAGIAAATDAIMRANHFQLMGVTRTYWEFLRGMGLGVTISLTAEGLAFWLLGSLAKKYAVELRPIFWVFGLAYLAFALNSYFYFFAAPVIVEILIAACFFGAIAAARPAAAIQKV